jgi:hypothetical protein
MARQGVEPQTTLGELRGGRPGEGETRRRALTGWGAIGNRKRLLLALAATVLVSLAALLVQWGVQAGLLLGLLSASVTGLIDDRLSVAAGLVCLACCPILLIADQNLWLYRSSLVTYYAANVGIYNLTNAADEIAVWAYYFLCIGVAAQIVRCVAQRKWRDSEQQSIRTV